MIDQELQAQLRERFNPDVSKLRDMQLKILEIMDAVDVICRRNNIPYWLASGTLIGAVRHGGFIPWDDDLDIEILHSDKKRFIEACQRELPEKYKLQCHATDDAYCLNILKIRDTESEMHEVRRWNGNEYPVKYKYNGYFIDIFTVEKSARPLIWVSRVPIRILSIAQFQWKANRIFLSIIYYLCEGVYAILRLLAMLNPFGKYYYHSFGSWFMSRRVKSEMVPPVEIEFEGKKYFAPNNYDAYLKRIYGDYMQLPESAKQSPSHNTELKKI